jgi:hypothetical protein
MLKKKYSATQIANKYRRQKDSAFMYRLIIVLIHYTLNSG